MAYDPNCEETKAAIAEAVAEAKKPLEKKRDELLNEVRDLKAKVREGGTDPLEVAKLEKKLEEAETALNATQSDLKKVIKERDTFKTNFEAESLFSDQTMLQNELTSALAANKIAPQFMDAAKALLAAQAKVVRNGAERAVLAGDKPLADHVKAWAESDTGKHFVAAPSNGGGNGNGGGGEGGGKQMKRSQFDALDGISQAKAAREYEIVEG